MTRYSNGAYQRASGTRGAFAGLSAALVAEGYPEIQINSGDREPADQIREFLKKFVPSSGAGDVGPYNDRRFWPGHGWYKRVVVGGTVAVPETSNHEKRRAADLAYPYNSNTAAHRRAQQLAPRFNITCEGLGFSEWWHWAYWGPLGTIDQPGSAAGGSTTQEDDMTPDESNKLNYIFNALAKPYGDQLTAIINVIRNETAGQIADSVKFPGQPFNGFLALANNQSAILEAIKGLDPSKSADIASFETKLRESETRQTVAITEAVEQSVNHLRETIAQALADGGVSPYADVRKAVDDAFDEVFVRSSQS